VLCGGDARLQGGGECTEVDLGLRCLCWSPIANLAPDFYNLTRELDVGGQICGPRLELLLGVLKKFVGQGTVRGCFIAKHACAWQQSIATNN
jgi:hypothetical protein